MQECCAYELELAVSEKARIIFWSSSFLLNARRFLTYKALEYIFYNFFLSPFSLVSRQRKRVGVDNANQFIELGNIIV